MSGRRASAHQLPLPRPLPGERERCAAGAYGTAETLYRASLGHFGKSAIAA